MKPSRGSLPPRNGGSRRGVTVRARVSGLGFRVSETNPAPRPSPGRGEGSHAGFTLIEVLVALAILATSLVVLLESVGSSIRLSEISRDMTVAAMIARDKMTEIEIEGKYVIGEKDGDFEDRYPGFAWHQAIAEAMFPGILEVDLTVLWGDPDQPERLTLTSFVQATEESYSEVPPEGTDDDTGTGGSSSGGSSSGGSPTGGGKTTP